ncbi:MAG: hypothetical protein H0W72_08960 [Planctomycetes bacterium]|nr:hypothetical protein [Planctomycetota bacterium]
MMSPLALAIANLIDRVSDRELVDALNPRLVDDISEKTAHRLRSETAAGTIARWDGERLEALCAWEAHAYGTATVADSLKIPIDDDGLLKTELHVLLMAAVAEDNRTGVAIANAACDFHYDLKEMIAIRQQFTAKLKAWAPAMRQLVRQIAAEQEQRRRGER